MPALFCLGFYDTLAHANSQLLPNECIVAYLDDIYLLPPRDRLRPAYDTVTSSIRLHAGIEPNLGKTESWCAGGGPAPEGVAELGAPQSVGGARRRVWKADAPLSERGVEVMEAPLGRVAKYNPDRTVSDEGRFVTN